MQQIERLSPAEIDAAKPLLAELLCAAVNEGAALGFLPPLRMPAAGSYWRGVRDAVANGSRILLLARGPQANGIRPVQGTVQLALAAEASGRHRATVQMLVVARRARRQGVGRALLQGADRAAVEAGRDLLLLEARPEDVVVRLCLALGWASCGRIPGFSIDPNGTRSTALVLARWLGNGTPGGPLGLLPGVG